MAYMPPKRGWVQALVSSTWLVLEGCRGCGKKFSHTGCDLERVLGQHSFLPFLLLPQVNRLPPHMPTLCATSQTLNSRGLWTETSEIVILNKPSFSLFIFSGVFHSAKKLAQVRSWRVLWNEGLRRRATQIPPGLAYLLPRAIKWGIQTWGSLGTHCSHSLFFFQNRQRRAERRPAPIRWTSQWLASWALSNHGHQNWTA